MLEKSPATRHFFDLIHRNDNNNQEILFPHMPLYIQGPDVKKMQSKGFRYMWLDEPWLYDTGTIDEAKGRLGDFLKLGTSKLLCTSQGGLAGDQWDIQFQSGELNEWNVQCLKCGVYQSPEFGGERADESRWGIVWDEIKLPNGDWDIEKCKLTVRYECQICGHPHMDGARTKSEWNRTGKYVVVGPEKRDKKSFRWTSVIDYPWTELVDQYLSARNQSNLGNDEPTTIFWQKRGPRCYDPTRQFDGPRVKGVRIELTPGNPTPIVHEGIEFPHLCMAVDVQIDYYVGLIMAFSARGDELVLWFDPHVESKQYLVDKQKEFGVPDESVMWDVSHRRAEIIIECCMHGHLDSKKRWVCWKALQGSDQQNFVHVPHSGPDRGKRIVLPYQWPPEIGNPSIGMRRDDPRLPLLRGKQCQIIRWSNNWIKDVVIARRDGRAAGVKTFVRKGEWNKEFIAQLHSQKKVQKENGRWVWEKFHARTPDHANDCKCMCTVRAWQLGVIGVESSEGN